ncbi:MAG TPA: DUF6496 domain-containing protein [Thermoanaerobaculia bacterium]|nr:DUF6496 domain-containing protein [Thermoanaerobaculia bacterium]
MPEKETVRRAQKAKREGKAPSTQAGEFVREEIEHIREGEHGARSPEQAIAIGLSKARRAGVKLPPPEKGKASERTRKQASRDLAKGKKPPSKRKPSPKRSRAAARALDDEPRSTASSQALSRHAKSAAARRTKADRSRAARKAAATRKKK